MQFNTTEEILANDHFRAWYYKDDARKTKEWESWLLQNQQYMFMVKEAIELMSKLDISEQEPSPEQVDRAFQNLQHALDATPVIEMKPAKKRWWIPAAAAVVLLSLGAYAFWSSMQEKTAMGSTYGSISEYKLPDGSQVTLNANSEIVVGKSWEKDSDREVWLKGEAFFMVQKTSHQNRFIVHANNMDIIVTGTQFNVISREEESSILLTEGSVTIRTADGTEMQMVPGDYVRLDNNAPAKEPVDQERILAWKQSKLDFENTSIREVARIISRHYGIKVSLHDSAIGERTISGIMPNDNLDILIEALEATGDFRITKGSKEITISGL